MGKESSNGDMRKSLFLLHAQINNFLVSFSISSFKLKSYKFAS